MGYPFRPVTERVARIRRAYREVQPEICTARYRIVTDFYRGHPELSGILRRAKALYAICEQIPVRIGEEEVIVGAQSARFRAAALYPENCVTFLRQEIGDGSIRTRDVDPYIISDADARYVLDTLSYWEGESNDAKTRAYIVDEYLPHENNGVTMLGSGVIVDTPVGHFVAGYDKVIRKGFGAIGTEARVKMRAIVDAHMPEHDSVDKYNFYRAVSIVSDAAVLLTKRYAAKAAELRDACAVPSRRAELGRMADALAWCVEKPARSFHEAVQALFMYQTVLCLDANMHGISLGRVDQYLGDYLERDLAAGVLREDEAQELLDLMYLKIAEMNKPWSYGATQSNPGYTSGQMMCLGGVDKDGNDASNRVSYMMLESMARLVLHDPPQSLRVHKDTPKALWELAIETTKICGGVPTFESDEAIIPALMERGMSLEDARNYSLIGCVEPGGTGNEWPACGGTGSVSYLNIVNALWLAINDGHLPNVGSYGLEREGGRARTAVTHRVGLPTGYLYEMESFERVLAAFQAQLRFFVGWHAMCVNQCEYVMREQLPLPVVSATMDGCMESGRDVMYGGAKYNSCGMAGVGIGNVADCLYFIKRLCFDEKKCTTRELFDALQNDWKGYEALQSYIRYDCEHYGNGNDEVDTWAGWAGQAFRDAVVECVNPRRCHYAAGLYPVTTNVMFGMMTAATPDGRSACAPLADGISPVQGMDKLGPTQVIRSVAQVARCHYGNGTLCNMKFSPSCFNGADGAEKLTQLVQTYFDMGGMELQINVISADTLREAQRKPEEYKDLVVRVAGFSAYFVELHITGQNDLISRTELEI